MTGAGASRTSVGGLGAQDARSLVAGLDAAVSRAVDDLARAIAARATDGEPPPVETLQQEAVGFGSTVAAHLVRLADELAKLAPAHAERTRTVVDQLGHYVAGWIDGGGIVLALLLDLAPEAFADPTAIGDLLRPRVRFVAGRAEAALAPVLDALPKPAPPPVAAPPPPVAAPPVDPKVRLAALLAKAAQLGVRIKNVPEAPSDRYLDKLEAQLAGVEAKRAADLAAAAPRQERLKVLMEFAERLKVRVKEVPAAPTEQWLDKMEAKLVEVALKKGAPLPPSLRPASATETRPTGDRPPERSLAPPLPEPGAIDRSLDRTVSEDAVTTQEVATYEPFGEERRRKVEALLERAAEAGLELGRVPPDPSDDWIAETQTKLDEAIERKKAERKAERLRREAERRARIERLQTQALELGVDLGPFPPFPTDDWLARAEIRVQAALLTPSEEVGADKRAERLSAVLDAARARNVPLGDVPDDPDEVWLAWAESRLAEAEAADEAIAVESEGPDQPTAFLVFEEGTVQEQRWPVSDGELTIGRGRGNVVQIRDDAGVSRRHCTILREDGRWFLRDEGSTKGTIVNGRKETGRVELHGDEVILCGETKFVFRLQDAP